MTGEAILSFVQNKGRASVKKERWRINEEISPRSARSTMGLPPFLLQCGMLVWSCSINSSCRVNYFPRRSLYWELFKCLRVYTYWNSISECEVNKPKMCQNRFILISRTCFEFNLYMELTKSLYSCNTLLFSQFISALWVHFYSKNKIRA